MIHYIIQVILFQLLFVMVYDLFLKKETFFNYNRLYLLGSSVVSFVIPFLKFEVIQQTIPQEYRVQLPAILIGNSPAETSTTASMLLEEVLIKQHGILWSDIVLLAYAAGAVISLAVFVLKLRKLYGMKKTAFLENFESYTLAILPNSEAAFSYMKTVFLGATISEAQKKHILQHELVHVKQRHTLDLLFFELLRIVFWFNPMTYIFQRKLQALHEYTADRIVAQRNKTDYYQNLLSQVFGTNSISFINTFYKSSLIKKRIVMLQKSNSNRLVQLKYLLVIPVFAVMLIYTSCSNEKPSDSDEVANLSVQTDSDSEVMQKINELAEAIMKKGNISDEEARALKFLAMEAKEGDKIYTSVQEYLDTAPMAMTEIDKVPTYAGCSGSNEELKKCMASEISKFVAEQFNTKLANDVELTGRQRISVQFTIDKNGMVADVKARAPHPILETEAVRVVSMLPQMTPGEQKGKKVGVLYALPIVFEINE